MNPEERVTRQEVIVNLELDCDLAPAAQSDRLEDTINFRALTGTRPNDLYRDLTGRDPRE